MWGCTQTDRQTEWQTNRTDCITSTSAEVIMWISHHTVNLLHLLSIIVGLTYLFYVMTNFVAYHIFVHRSRSTRSDHVNIWCGSFVCRPWELYNRPNPFPFDWLWRLHFAPVKWLAGLRPFLKWHVTSRDQIQFWRPAEVAVHSIVFSIFASSVKVWHRHMSSSFRGCTSCFGECTSYFSESVLLFLSVSVPHVSDKSS